MRFERIEDSPNPELKRIRDIRNALEHKYVKVYHDLFKDQIEKNGDGLAFYVSEKELYDATLVLLKILREAIINVSLCVNIAEADKIKEHKNEEIPSIPLDAYDDKWKT